MEGEYQNRQQERWGGRVTQKCQDERDASLKKKCFVCMYRYACECMFVCVGWGWVGGMK